MNQWEQCIIYENSSIIDALQAIETSAMQVALVTDEKKRLLGIATDGDIRRAILNKMPLSTCVTEVMNKKPVVGGINDDRDTVLGIMRRCQISQLPIVNEQGIVISLEILSEILQERKKSNIVFIMAGGLGTRLMPLTNSCPKPMLPIGNKPILELILENFIAHNFYKFYISVNYKAEVIMDYFGNGQKWGVEIKYIKEEKRLGTVGALSLLENVHETEEIIVINGDVLTKVNFSHLLEFSKNSQSDAVMCVREYNIQIPYGVVQVNSDQILEDIIEKPVQRFLISAGIYVLKPVALSYIPKNTFLDMPVLFEMLMKDNHKTSVFPVSDYWMDIGQKEDYEQVRNGYEEDCK